jgi:hypothetical protein
MTLFLFRVDDTHTYNPKKVNFTLVISYYLLLETGTVNNFNNAESNITNIWKLSSLISNNVILYLCWTAFK